MLNFVALKVKLNVVAKFCGAEVDNYGEEVVGFDSGGLGGEVWLGSFNSFFSFHFFFVLINFNY